MLALAVAGMSGAAVAGSAWAADPAAQRFLDAPVPSACDHPAGQLSGGTLPGVPEGRGGVSLRGLVSDGMVAQGALGEGRSGDAAVVLACSQGGVGWPDHIVLYDQQNAILGSIDLYDATHGGRESVHRIWIARHTVFVEVANIARDGDALCCGSASAQLQLRWNAQRGLFVHKVKIYRERTTAARFVKAVKRGNRRAARRYAAPDAVKTIFKLRGRTRLSLRRCYGVLDEVTATWFELFPGTSRMCVLVAKWKGGPYASGYGLFMERRGWKDWRVAVAYGIAG